MIRNLNHQAIRFNSKIQTPQASDSDNEPPQNYHHKCVSELLSKHLLYKFDKPMKLQHLENTYNLKSFK